MLNKKKLKKAKTNLFSNQTEMTTLIQAYQIQADIRTTSETQDQDPQPHFDCDPIPTNSRANENYRREIESLKQQLL